MIAGLLATGAPYSDDSARSPWRQGGAADFHINVNTRFNDLRGNEDEAIAAAYPFNRNLNYLQTPRQKKRKTLPEVLTREEVFSIIESCRNIKHKAMLTVVYSKADFLHMVFHCPPTINRVEAMVGKGLVKIIADTGDGKVLGMHILGPLPAL